MRTDGWIHFRKIDWDSLENDRFSIDTRDFCCSQHKTEFVHEDISKILKLKQRFFFTKEELIALLERLFIESGGEGEWRYLYLDKDSWDLKYLRIQRYDEGFLICNSENRALNKEFLSNPVGQEYLNFIPHYKLKEN